MKCSVTVLIETYWNVKEAEDCFVLGNETAVLIETYWNVKEEVTKNSYFEVLVLIETYWNVKKYTQTADLGYIPY